MPGDLQGRRPCPRRGIGRRPHEFEAVAPTASTNPDLSGGHRAAGGPFRAEAPRDPTCLFAHQRGDESDHMSPGEGRAPAGACGRKMPPGGTAADEQSRISTGAGRRRCRAVKRLLRARGEGAPDSRDHAGRRAYCGRGRSRGAQAQMTAGRGRTVVQRLKANFLRGCGGQGRPGQGPGQRPSSREPGERCVGQGEMPGEHAMDRRGAAPAGSFVGGGRVASPESPRAAAALRSDAAMKGFNTVGRRGRPAGGDGVEDTDDRRL